MAFAYAPPLQWLFTDGHAVINLSTYYNDLVNLDKIDWDIMGRRYWADTLQDGDRERRRQAEFLVFQFFPWTLISRIGVMTEETKKLVENAIAPAGHKPTVEHQPEWYY
jgi:hypothetical protein